MIRNIERLPKKIYLIAAILLISACVLISLLPRAASDPIESAKSVLQGIPLYPGATQIYREDTDTQGGKIDHQDTFCSIECARVTYEAPDRPQQVLRFYESHATTGRWDRWRQWGAVSPVSGRTYYFGRVEFEGWQVFDSVFPWFRARYEMRLDYHIDIRAEDTKVPGITSVELIVRRRAPMPTDTPIPTLVPPPPTAPLPIVPGSVRTQQPKIPSTQPTAP